MSSFQANKNGLVVVKLLKNYGTNVAGETAGFLPEIAKALVKERIAHLPGQPPKAEKKADVQEDDAAMTSRKFRQQKDPLDHDGDGKKGGSAKQPPSAELVQARADYRTAFNKAPFGAWGIDEIKKRIAEKPADG